MNTLPSVQKISQTATENIQAFQAYAEIVLNASERLTSLNLEAARTAVSFAVSNVPSADKDVRDTFAAGMNIQGKGMEQAAEYFRNVNDVLVKTQSEITELNTRRINEATQSMQGLLDSFGKSGPAGASDIVAAMKTAMSNAATAYENFVKTSRDVAESNLAAATNALQPMVAAATKASRKAA